LSMYTFLTVRFCCMDSEAHARPAEVCVHLDVSMIC
jgi:hypothetical protein